MTMYIAFTALLNMSLVASVLAVVIILLRPLMKKAPKRYLCLMWAFVGLRLMIPFSISSRISAFNLFDTATGKSGQVEYFEFIDEGVKPQVQFLLPALMTDATSPERTAVGIQSSELYLPMLVYIWLAGMMLMLLYSLINYCKIRKRVAASFNKKDNIFVCDEVNSPFILGILKPNIYLPSGMGDDEQICVIAHEKAHMKRFDHVWKPLGYMLLAVYWFNPIMWLSYIMLCRDIEAACDEKVIRLMNNDEKAMYSQTLLSCARPRRMIAACPLAFCETGVKARIRGVLNYKKPALWIILVSILCCVAMAVFFLTNPLPKDDSAVSDASDHRILTATIAEINSDTMTVTPVEGSLGPDCIIVAINDLSPLPELRVGDTVEIAYNGEILEIYPAMLGEVFSVKVISSAQKEVALSSFAGIGTVTKTSSIVNVSDELEGIPCKQFKDMAGEYCYMSGAGGWQTRLILKEDGSFYGRYEDSGVDCIYRCDFAGVLQTPSEISEHVWLAQILKITYYEPGKEYMEGDVRIVTSEPHGLEKTSSVYIYCPGYPIKDLNADEYFWLSAEREEFRDKNKSYADEDELPCYVIRNVFEDGWFSKIPDE